MNVSRPICSMCVFSVPSRQKYMLSGNRVLKLESNYYLQSHRRVLSFAERVDLKKRGRWIKPCVQKTTSAGKYLIQPVVEMKLRANVQAGDLKTSVEVCDGTRRN